MTEVRARSALRRQALKVFVVSVLINAVLGVWALLSGDFGETQGKVLGTSFLVSAAMLGLLVNVPAIQRRSLWPAPLVGAIVGAAGFALFIALVWTEPSADVWFKVAGSFLVVAVAASLASGLALIPVPSRARWLRSVATGLIGLLALTILIGLWAEPDNDAYARFVGVQGVAVAAVTLLVPALSRFRSPVDGEGRRIDLESTQPVVRFCPSYGAPVLHRPLEFAAPTTCPACGLTFVVNAVGPRPQGPTVAGTSTSSS